MDADRAALATQADGKRTRKGLIAGALALLGAGALVEAKPARAGSDGDVVLGGNNVATTPTIIDGSAGSNETLVLFANTADALSADAGSGNGVYATTGSPSNSGVAGRNADVGPGVWGASTGGAGVYGLGAVPGSEGVYGQSGGVTGTTPGKTRNGIHGVTNSPTDSGVWGENVGGGYGMFGSTSASGLAGGAGVAGLNNGSGPGVRGASQSGAGVYGFATSSEGVYARSGNTDGTTPGTTRSGVHGVTNSASAGAVWGENVGGGDGVQGTSGGGNGVHGQATASAGVGVLAENTGGGLALKATGPVELDARVSFTRSGSVVIPSGATKATVTPPGALTASSLVLALLQNVAGGVMVKAAVPNPGAGTFQIVLNKAPLAPATATVAWLVVN
jgi:hypothetical protein